MFDVFLRGMSDPKGWVRYDAAWALGESRTTDPRAIAALELLALVRARSRPLGRQGARRLSGRRVAGLAAADFLTSASARRAGVSRRQARDTLTGALLLALRRSARGRRLSCLACARPCLPCGRSCRPEGWALRSALSLCTLLCARSCRPSARPCARLCRLASFFALGLVGHAFGLALGFVFLAFSLVGLVFGFPLFVALVHLLAAESVRAAHVRVAEEVVAWQPRAPAAGAAVVRRLAARAVARAAAAEAHQPASHHPGAAGEGPAGPAGPAAPPRAGPRGRAGCDACGSCMRRVTGQLSRPAKTPAQTNGGS